MNADINFSKVIKLSKLSDERVDDIDETLKMYDEAENYINKYEWCKEIKTSYLGFAYPGVVGVFLFNINPAWEGVDEWIWVIVGDLPPAYIAVENFNNPAKALNAYVGAMEEWVDAAYEGKSVSELIPVNVPATKEYSEMLNSRLKFLDDRILSMYSSDLDDNQE